MLKMRLVDLYYLEQSALNVIIEWFDNKLSDNNLASELVENRSCLIKL